MHSFRRQYGAKYRRQSKKEMVQATREHEKQLSLSTSTTRRKMILRRQITVVVTMVGLFLLAGIALRSTIFKTPDWSPTQASGAIKSGSAK